MLAAREPIRWRHAMAGASCATHHERRSQVETHRRCVLYARDRNKSGSCVESSGGVVILHAQAQRAVPLLTGASRDTRKERRPDPAASGIVSNRQRKLGNARLDEAVAVVGFGEESVPASTQTDSVCVGERASIARTPPSRDVFGDVRHRYRFTHREPRRSRSPCERLDQHLVKKPKILRTRRSWTHTPLRNHNATIAPRSMRCTAR